MELDAVTREPSSNPPSVNLRIETAVEDLLGGLSGPPTPLAPVGSRLGVDLIAYRSGLPVSGMLESAGDSLRIVCAADQPAVRRRFTVAHELGHAFLAGHENSLPEEMHEQFCDRFAAELLMPARDMRESDLDDLSIGRLRLLARRFGTSLRATAIRCAEFSSLAVVVAEGSRVVWSAGALRELNPFLAGISDRARAQGEETRQRVSRKSHSAQENWLLESAPHGTGQAILLLRREP